MVCQWKIRGFFCVERCAGSASESDKKAYQPAAVEKVGLVQRSSAVAARALLVQKEV